MTTERRSITGPHSVVAFYFGLYFPSTYTQDEAKLNVNVPLNGGENNGRIHFGMVKRWPRPNRGGRLTEVQFPILFFNYFGTLITGRVIGDRLMEV